MKQEINKYEKKIAELHTQLETEARQLGEVQSRKEFEQREITRLQKEHSMLQAQIDKKQILSDTLAQNIQAKKDESQVVLATKRIKQSELVKSIEAAKTQLVRIQGQIKEGKKLLKTYNGLETKYESLKRKFRILGSLMKKIEQDTKARNEKAKKTLLSAMEIRDSANQHIDYIQSQKTSLENRERSLRVYAKRVKKYYEEKGLPLPQDL